MPRGTRVISIVMEIFFYLIVVEVIQLFMITKIHQTVLLNEKVYYM